MTATGAFSSPRARWLAPAAGLILLAIFVAPVVAPGVQLYYRDTGRLYYPLKLYVAQALARGRLALWDSMCEAGVSLLGQVTPGLLHPFTLLYAALPFDIAFKLNHLFGLLLGGIGTYRLGRRLGASPWACLAGAAAYGGSGYLVSMAASNLPYALGAGSLPIAVDALLGFLDRPGVGRMLWGAVALALVAYAGEPQSMWFAGLIGGVWAVLRGAGTTRLRGALHGAGLAAAWGALALCLAAPVALTGAWQLRRSDRAQALSASERRMFANHPARLFGLLVPRAFDDVPERAKGPESNRGLSYFQEYFAADEPAFSDSIILGAPALLFAACAAWTGMRGRILLLGAALFALASTGEALGIDQAILGVLPGARIFRYAEKLIGPSLLLFSLAAILGADRALGSSRRAAIGFAAGAAALAGACAALALVAGSGSPQVASALVARGTLHDRELAARFLEELRAGLWDAAALSLVAALAGGLRAARPTRNLAALGAACCAASVFASSAGLLPVTAAEMLRGPYLLGELLFRRAGPSPGRWRLFVNKGPVPVVAALPGRVGRTHGLAQALMPQFNSVNGIEGVATYSSAGDRLYVMLANEVPGVFFSLFSVRFAVEMPLKLAAETARRLGFERMGPGYWVREYAVGPRAFLVSDARRVRSSGEALRILSRPGFDPHLMAVVRGDPGGPLPESGGRLPAVDYRRPSPERMEVDADLPAQSLLVLSERYDHGWRATVDGREAPVVEVDLAAMGVLLPPGRHAARLRFWPAGFTLGLWVLVATLAGFAAISLLGSTRGRRQSLSAEGRFPSTPGSGEVVTGADL